MKSANTRFSRCLTRLLAVALLLSAWDGWSDERPSASELPGIHNFFRVTTNVLSGSQPEGDASFAALAKLGVRTIISVDGAKPDVELARKHGLRYVHLPFGYDGIPTNRVAELAKAAQVLPGPIYVHCHHGKHRGPAAVSIICLADEGWTPAQAEDFLLKAGTGAEYSGLYRAAREFKPLRAAELAAVSTNFPAVARTASIVDAMVAIDAIHDRLKLVRDEGWAAPSDHSDVSPSHEALMLLEQYRELARTEDTARRSEDFRAKLDAALRAADVLHTKLSNRNVLLDEAFRRVGQSCADCHHKYRNE